MKNGFTVPDVVGGIIVADVIPPVGVIPPAGVIQPDGVGGVNAELMFLESRVLVSGVPESGNAAIARLSGDGARLIATLRGGVEERLGCTGVCGTLMRRRSGDIQRKGDAQRKDDSCRGSIICLSVITIVVDRKGEAHRRADLDPWSATCSSIIRVAGNGELVLRTLRDDGKGDTHQRGVLSSFIHDGVEESSPPSAISKGVVSVGQSSPA
jgi:hypothetical protein